jgi:peroxiredoxin
VTVRLWVALLLAALLLVYPSVARPEDPFRDLDLIRPNRSTAAPDFSVPGLKGERIALRDLRGKVVFLNFWATWCSPCREEMPSMERLYRRYKDRGVTMVAISVDNGAPRVVADFVKILGLTFLIGLDPKMEAANRYALRALPTSFLIDKNGNTVAFALGPRTWDGNAAHAVMESLLR